MSASDTTGFGKFVPGFDFLQNLTKGASGMSPMPSLASWVAPSLNVEELDKRIGELKNVHFWLEQNSRALAATIQALEVQKMTLVTLKGMNFNLADVANALHPRMPEAADAPRAEAPSSPAPAPEPEPEPPLSDASKEAAGAAQAPMSGMVDPLKLWGALTQQFQQIAATAVQEAASKAAEMEKAHSAATGKAAAKTPRKAPAKKAAAKSAAGAKTAPRKTGAR